MILRTPLLCSWRRQMNYLLDTNVLYWTFFETHKVRPAIREICLAQKGNVFYSPINLWEISIKYRKNKLKLGGGISPEAFLAELEISPFPCKPLDNYILASSHRLPLLHSDPFDRILIWDAISSGFTLISDDSRFTQYRRCGLLLL